MEQLNGQLDEWSISYYTGALEAMKREFEDLKRSLNFAMRTLRWFECRFKQFETLFKHLAAGTWKPMATAPTNGKPVLLKLSSGEFVVARWENDRWEVISEDVELKPIAWAEPLE